jgi:hypothetical protein
VDAATVCNEVLLRVTLRRHRRASRKHEANSSNCTQNSCLAIRGDWILTGILGKCFHARTHGWPRDQRRTPWGDVALLGNCYLPSTTVTGRSTAVVDTARAHRRGNFNTAASVRDERASQQILPNASEQLRTYMQQRESGCENAAYNVGTRRHQSRRVRHSSRPSPKSYQ